MRAVGDLNMPRQQQPGPQRRSMTPGEMDLFLEAHADRKMLSNLEAAAASRTGIPLNWRAGPAAPLSGTGPQRLEALRRSQGMA